MPLMEPLLNAVPFASQGDKNNIPIDPSLDPDPIAQAAASFKLGFPPNTRKKISLGGVPPSGRDMNGILNFLSQHQVWLNAGGAYKFNGPLAEALGGYQQGAILASNDGLRLYVSTVDGNTTDFNSDMTGWKMIGTSELQALLDTLQTNINNEETARIATGDFLNGRIDFEIGERIAGDNALSDRVWILEHKPDQPAIGFGQNYVDVTASRVSGVNYPNTTGRPLQVTIFLVGANDSAVNNFYVNDVFVFSLANRESSGQSKACSVIVPVNGYCKIIGAFSNWVELR